MHILETYFWYIKTAKISEKGILPMDSLKLHLNAVKIKNSFTMYKNIEINVEQNSKYEMRPIQKKSSYRIGNANGVGVRLIIKSAEADNLSVTDSVNGFSLGSKLDIISVGYLETCMNLETSIATWKN